jgi:hypothetical protein
MASQQTFRIPVWVPLLLIGIAAATLVACSAHLFKRSKAKWPW